VRVSVPKKRFRKSSSYTEPVPIPSDPEPLDVSIPQAMWFGDWSPSAVQRLCAAGEIESYLLGGKRRIVLASLKAYRERCRLLGPQFSVRPKTGKRPVRRPRKPRPEASQAG
jgi:hypothetical protein